MKRFFTTLLFLQIAILLFTQDIVQWRGPDRDGIYKETGLLTMWPESGPEMLWHYDELGDGHGSATVTKERVFTTGTIDGIGYVYALDHSGNLIWKSEIGKSWTDNWDGVRTTPLYYRGKIYIMSAFGKLVCMDPTDGNYIWDVDLFKKYGGRNIKWGVTENLLISDNKLFVTIGGTQANVIALSPLDGKLIWSCRGNGEISAYNSPAVFDHNGRKILVTQTQNSILGIDATEGNLLWSFEHINQWDVHPNTALYQDGFIYVVSGYGKGGVKLKLSEDGSSVTLIWRNESLDNQMGGVILHNGRLYGGGHNNRKYFCIDWETGEELYSTRTFQRGNTIFAEGLLYFYDERGKIGLIKPGNNSFEVVGTFEVPLGKNQHWAHLVIAGKRLYVRHGTSLMVYDIGR